MTPTQCPKSLLSEVDRSHWNQLGLFHRPRSFVTEWHIRAVLPRFAVWSILGWLGTLNLDLQDAWQHLSGGCRVAPNGSDLQKLHRDEEPRGCQQQVVGVCSNQLQRACIVRRTQNNGAANFAPPFFPLRSKRNYGFAP